MSSFEGKKKARKYPTTTANLWVVITFAQGRKHSGFLLSTAVDTFYYYCKTLFNFTMDLILLILQVIKICKIKYPQQFKL